MAKKLVNTATGKLEDNVLDQKLNPDEGIEAISNAESNFDFDSDELLSGNTDVLSTSDMDTGALEYMTSETSAMNQNVQAESTSFLKNASNAVAAGITKGAVGVLDPFAMGLAWGLEKMGLDDTADVVSNFTDGIKTDLGDMFGINDYQVDPNGSILDNFLKFSTLESIVSSATQFGLLGLGSAQAVTTAGNLARTAGVGLYRANKASSLAKGVSKVLMETGRVLNKPVSVLGTQIKSNTLARAALSNQMEGIIMADEIRKNIEKDYAHIIYDPNASDKLKNSIEENIKQSQSDMMLYNSAMMFSDYVGFSKFLPNSVNAKSLMKNIGKASVLVAPWEGAEEMYQSLVQKEQEYDAYKGIEEAYSKLSSSDKIDGIGGVSDNYFDSGNTLLSISNQSKANEIAHQNKLTFAERLMENAESTSTWVETLSGVFGGGPQFMITGLPNYIQNRKVRAEQKKQAKAFSTESKAIFDAVIASNVRDEVALDALMQDLDEFIPEGVDDDVIKEVVNDYAVSDRALKAILNNGVDGAMDFVEETRNSIDERIEAGELTDEEGKKYKKNLDKLENTVKKYEKFLTYSNAEELIAVQKNLDLYEALNKAFENDEEPSSRQSNLVSVFSNDKSRETADTTVSDAETDMSGDSSASEIAAETLVDGTGTTNSNTESETVQTADAKNTEVDENGNPIEGSIVKEAEIQNEIDNNEGSKVNRNVNETTNSESARNVNRAKEIMAQEALDNINQSETIDENTSKKTSASNKTNKPKTTAEIKQAIQDKLATAKKKKAELLSLDGQMKGYMKQSLRKKIGDYEVKLNKVTDSSVLIGDINDLVELYENETDDLTKMYYSEKMRVAFTRLNTLADIENNTKKTNVVNKNKKQKKKKAEEEGVNDDNTSLDEMAQQTYDILNASEDFEINLEDVTDFVEISFSDSLNRKQMRKLVQKVMDLQSTQTNNNNIDENVTVTPEQSIRDLAKSEDAFEPEPGNEIIDKSGLEDYLMILYPDDFKQGVPLDMLDDLYNVYVSEYNRDDSSEKLGEARSDSMVLQQAADRFDQTVQEDPQDIEESLNEVTSRVNRMVESGKDLNNLNDSDKNDIIETNLTLMNTFSKLIGNYREVRQMNGLSDRMPTYSDILAIMNIQGIDTKSNEPAIKMLYGFLTGQQFSDITTNKRVIEEYDDTNDKYNKKPDYVEKDDMTVETHPLVSNAIAWNQDVMIDYTEINEGTDIEFEVMSDEDIENEPDFPIYTGTIEGEITIYENWSEFKKSKDASNPLYNDASMRPIAIYANTSTGRVRIGFVHTNQWAGLKRKRQVDAKLNAKLRADNMKIRRNIMEAHNKGEKISGKITARKSNISFTENFVSGIAVKFKKENETGLDDYRQTDNRLGELISDPTNRPVFALVGEDGKIHEDFAEMLSKKGIKEVQVPAEVSPGSTVVVVPLENSGKAVAIKLINKRMPVNAFEYVIRKFMKIYKDGKFVGVSPQYLNAMFDNTMGSTASLTGTKRDLAVNVAHSKSNKTVTITFRLEDTNHQVVLEYAKGENRKYIYRVQNKNDAVKAESFLMQLIKSAKMSNTADESGLPMYHITKQNLLQAQQGRNKELYTLGRDPNSNNNNYSDYEMSKDNGYLEVMIGANTMTNLDFPVQLPNGEWVFTTNTITNFSINRDTDKTNSKKDTVDKGTDNAKKITKKGVAALEKRKKNYTASLAKLNKYSKFNLNYKKIVIALNSYGRRYAETDMIEDSEKVMNTSEDILTTLDAILKFKNTLVSDIKANEKIVDEAETRALKDLNDLMKSVAQLRNFANSVSKIGKMGDKYKLGFGKETIDNLITKGSSKDIQAIIDSLDKANSINDKKLEGTKSRVNKMVSSDDYEDDLFDELDDDFDLDLDDDLDEDFEIEDEVEPKPKSTKMDVIIDGRTFTASSQVDKAVLDITNSNNLITFTDDNGELC